MKQRGLVLLLTLLLLPIALLLLLINLQGMQQLQQVFALKSATLKERPRQTRALAAFEANVLANLHCRLPFALVSGHHGFAWWQAHGCLWVWEGGQYYAVINDAGHNTCLGAHFFRIQLYSGALGQRSIQQVVESVYAVPAGSARVCDADNGFSWGRQHWRFA